jgi:xanthine dehydrogenase accessory factor
MRREILDRLNRARHDGLAAVRAADLETGDELLIDPSVDRSALGLAAARAARDDRSGPIEIEGRTWFLAVHNPPLDLAIIGAVHIAQPLAGMAAMTGYGVRVIDPRTAFATAERFPGITLVHAWADEALTKTPLGPRSAVVAVTHDPKLDDPALAAALNSDCFYIGALGSKKTHAGRLARLKQSGYTDEQLARIRGPVGLNIGAKSPAEIAISILAEMTQVLRAGDRREQPAANASA